MQSNKKSFIFKTSGSSGMPKTVKKSYEALITEARDMADFFKFPPDTVILSTVSSEHMYGMTFTVMLAQVAGCRVDKERIFYTEDIKDYEKFIFVSTPSFLEKLAKYGFKFKNKPLMIFSAGAALDDSVFEYLEEISQGVTEIYGSSEAGVIAYRQSHKSLLKTFDNVSMEIEGDKITVKSEYFDEPEIVLDDELEFFNDGFKVQGRKDRIVKIQEKRISLDAVENILNSNELIEKSYCLKLNDKLCAAVVLNEKGRQILEKNGKLELVKTIKSNMAGAAARCKKWRFLFELPVNERGKINGKRVKEIFNTNLTYPDVIDFSINSTDARFDLIFPQKSNFFKGHFPEFPILPGVVQLFFVKEFIKDAFNLDFVPQKVKKVKFSSVIKPDEKVSLCLKKSETSIDYKFTKGDKIFSSGTFVL